MQITGLTDKGLVRSENQDTFVYGYTANDTLYAGVFDGMGGAEGRQVREQHGREHV